MGSLAHAAAGWRLPIVCLLGLALVPCAGAAPSRAPGLPVAGASTLAFPAAVTAGTPVSLVIVGRDALGVLSPGHPEVFAVAVSGANPQAALTVTDLGGGSYGAGYTPTRRGVDTVAVTIAGTGVGGSPAAILVGPAAPDAGQSSATVGPGVAGRVTPVTISVRDAYGNLVPTGGAVTAAVAGANAGAATTLADNHDGTWTLSYTPTHVGTDTFAVTVNGAPIGGAPAASLVQAGAPDPAHVRANLPGGTAGAATAVSLDVRDAWDNPVLGGAAALGVTVGGANPAGSVPVAFSGAGSVYTASYTPTLAGVDSVAVTLDGAPVAGSPFTTTVAAGAPVAAQGLLAASRTSATANGSDAVTVTITCRDAWYNLVPGVPAARLALRVSPATGTALSPLSGVTDAQGRLTCTLTSTVAGPVTVNGSLDGTDLPRTLALQFAAGPADAATSTFTASRPTAAADGRDTVVLTLTVRDARGNPVAGLPAGALWVSPSPAAGVTVTGPTTATDAAGEATFTATSTANGTVTFQAMVSGSPVTQTVTVTFGAGTGGGTGLSLTAARTTATADGQDAVTLTVTVRDGQGGPVAGLPASSLSFAANPSTGVSVTGPIAATDANGRTTATVTSTRAGSVQLTVATTGATSAPVGITFTPGPAVAATSTATAVRSIGVADGLDALPVTLTARDAQGNPVAGVPAAAFAVVASPPTGVSILGPDTATDAAGQTSLIVRSTQVGNLALHVTLNGAPLPQDVTLAFPGGQPAAANCDVVADTATATADGVQAVHLTVTVRDAQGNPVAGLPGSTVTMTAAPSAGVYFTPPAGLSDSAGRLTFTVYSTTAATIAFTAAVGGTALPRSVSVAFQPGPVSPIVSKITIGGTLLADGRPVTIGIQLVDAHGNPRPGLAVQVTCVGLTVPAAPVTDAEGRTTVSLDTTTPGAYDLVVTAEGITLPVVRLTFAGGTIDPQRTGVVVNPQRIPADGSTLATLRIRLRNNHGQPVVGWPAESRSVLIRGTDTDGRGMTVVDPGGVSDADGGYTITLKATVRDVYAVTPMVGGTALTGCLITALDAHRLDLVPGQNFIGLPWLLDDPTAGAVFGASGWRLSTWDTVSGVFRLGAAGTRLLPGQGAFIHVDSPRQILLLANVPPVGELELGLRNGWDTFANPYDADLPWDLARFRVLLNGVDRGPLSDPATWELMRPYAWVWDAPTARYRLVFPISVPGYGGDVLTFVPRCAGMWLSARRDGVSLRLVPPSTSGRPAPEPPGPQDWALTLTGLAGGQSAEATVGQWSRLSEPMTIASPPDTGTGLSLAVVGAAGRVAGSLQPAGPPPSFDLVARSPDAGEVTLAWPSLRRQLPPGLVATLTDGASGQTVVLSGQAAYRYAARAGEERPFHLSFRFAHAQRPDILSLTAQPGRGRGLRVQLTVSEPATIRLVIRGLGGRLVRMLPAQTGTATVDLAWDGLDDAGRPVPAGNYQLEAAVVSANGGLARATRAVTVR